MLTLINRRGVDVFSPLAKSYQPAANSYPPSTIILAPCSSDFESSSNIYLQQTY